ncbi:hypothetical protein NUU61_000474 [Penicillium alfredii]|uniref:UBC core domain-containing protein n=1 Tax=Penicillium alfredii TaxID=1506179 RepID=A0A9W9G9M1_9EURO|nr:uncharacterized protein NUU61_000474 [Penicillium alfredii]KAJ5114715.1 hypothetical protein NUU61_000474 [Penicillium alfredii]
MPHKDFQKDLSEAAAPGRFPHLSEVRAGDYEGSISFTFTFSDSRLEFQAIVSDPHDYPKDHNYFVFATSENTPSAVTTSLENSQVLFPGFSIEDLLSSVDGMVNGVLVAPSQTSTHLDQSDDFSAGEDNEESDWEWEEENENPFFVPVSSGPELRLKIRRDLRVAKNAGFKVGYLGQITGTIIVLVSCRIARLGISEEVMQAWNVRPSDYLVLVIRYRPTYQDLQDILQEKDPKSPFVSMHVGLCESYKPSLAQAMLAIQGAATPDDQGESLVVPDLEQGHDLKSLFIGKPLKSLLNERFLGIVRLRLKHGFSWTGAELCFHTIQGKILGDSEVGRSEFFEPDNWTASPPAFLVADHMADAGMDASKLSLPLLAMQFTLRHFVKCTEFCLVCHCKTHDNFEALKPYVCSNGLCLYQYITLGMGPSLEYEIRTQPNVVDLLVSLTYDRARSGHLCDFPTGLGLRVPRKLSLPSISDGTSTTVQTSCDAAQLNPAKLELRPLKPHHAKVGDWITFMKPGSVLDMIPTQHWSGRIKHIGESSDYIYLSSSISRPDMSFPAEAPTGIVDVEFAIYEEKFDDLTFSQKQDAIVALLNTLPSITSMKSFLESSCNDTLLSSWKDRISPAALDLLRWIVASNRSCIMQDNDDPQHLVSGMDGYIQFRLAQGAPDKEQRFIDAVNSVSLAANPQHPTIFAWHGSPLRNWHSILREGLHFKNIANGRACGNGVYLSRHFGTSLGYTQVNRAPFLGWPNSRLNIQSVISLNEVVNAPQKFVCINPHYVVQYLDWIQPRYLFVKGNGFVSPPKPGEPPSLVYNQDPNRCAYGPKGTAIVIPISALSSQRRQNLDAEPKATPEQASPTKKSPSKFARAPSKKRKRGSKHEEEMSDDNVSVTTAVEDLKILLSDSDDDINEPPRKSSVDRNPAQDADPKTDFEPGTLSEENLPLLSPPEYATMSATKMLQQHLQAALRVQKREALHELGWYVDPSLIKTVYQWIVELHTFDPALPLSQDLKAANLKSVVLELRFPPQFPMDPPFVRVIRPRFLEFAHGGGGHVTAGGAMCMQLLTNSGWLPTASIESVLLQVRMAITNTEPRPARLAPRQQRKSYTVGEAVEAYKRACRTHGWQIPKDLQRLSW